MKIQNLLGHFLVYVLPLWWITFELKVSKEDGVELMWKTLSLATFGAPSVPGRVVEALHALPQVLSQQAGKGSSSGSHCSAVETQVPRGVKGFTITRGHGDMPAAGTQIHDSMVKVSTATPEKAEPSPSPATWPQSLREAVPSRAILCEPASGGPALSQGQVNLLFDNSLCPAKGFSVWTYF